MKFIVQTREDVVKLQGKFVLQLDETEPNKLLQDFKWEFVKEKRLYLIAGFSFVDLCGNICSHGKDYTDDSFEYFKNFFNSYLFEHMIKKGLTSGGRFHRLLTSKELDYLNQKLKEENY